MKTSETFEYERAMEDIKYPKPKCKIPYCGNNVKSFNDGLCLPCSKKKEEQKNKLDKASKLPGVRTRCLDCDELYIYCKCVYGDSVADKIDRPIIQKRNKEMNSRLNKELIKCESCLVGFSKEDIMGNCTCDDPYGFEQQNLKEAKCIDCGILYKDMGLDLVLPDQQWKIICPENKILCANCICKRAKKLGLATCVQSWIDNLDYSKPYE